MITFTSEIRKGFLLLWHYRYNAVAELFLMGFVFIGLSFFMGEGELESGQLASTLLGYLVWFFAMIAISNMSYNLTDEAQAGTLEQMFMSPAPIGVIVFGRVTAMFITAMIQVILVGGVLILLLDVYIPMRLIGIPVFLLTMVGLLGFGMIIGGLTLVLKQVHAIANLSQNVLIFLNGALLPVSFFPLWLEIFAKLLPSTMGIIVLRRVVLDGASLLDVWNDGSLVLLLANSLFYAVVGWSVFKYCERYAKNHGTLGHY